MKVVCTRCGKDLDGFTFYSIIDGRFYFFCSRNCQQKQEYSTDIDTWAEEIEEKAGPG